MVGPALASVQGAHLRVLEAQAELDAAAVAAWHEGATWAELGALLAMQPKSAWKRYSAGATATGSA